MLSRKGRMLVQTRVVAVAAASEGIGKPLEASLNRTGRCLSAFVAFVYRTEMNCGGQRTRAPAPESANSSSLMSPDSAAGGWLWRKSGAQLLVLDAGCFGHPGGEAEKATGSWQQSLPRREEL